MKASVSVRVPGKVMLCGEYSVLSGGHALAATLDRHLAVRIRPKAGLGGIYVASDLWEQPRFVGPSEAVSSDPLIDAVQHGMRLFGVSDLELRIDSELDIKFGFGSSSALRLGVLLALEEFARYVRGAPATRSRTELEPLAKEAYLLQRKAQSRASGYDVATQLAGGLVDFEKGADDGAWPKQVNICKLETQKNLSQLVHLFGGGAGAPTTPLVSSTLAWLEEQGSLEALGRANEELRHAFLEALTHPEDRAMQQNLCAATRAQRQLFAHAPNYPRDVAARLASLPGCDEKWTFKTTGAGGEDALMLLGSHIDLGPAETALKEMGWQRIAVGFETAGARITRGALPHA